MNYSFQHDDPKVFADAVRDAYLPLFLELCARDEAAKRARAARAARRRAFAAATDGRDGGWPDAASREAWALERAAWRRAWEP